MVYSIPITSFHEIQPLFKLIEAESDNVSSIPEINELKGLINECGISNTTLEEVFMKVTGKKQAKTEADAMTSE